MIISTGTMGIVLLHLKRPEQYYATETENFTCGLVEHNIVLISGSV
jgi:hypothetical protein